MAQGENKTGKEWRCNWSINDWWEKSQTGGLRGTKEGEKIKITEGTSPEWEWQELLKTNR